MTLSDFIEAEGHGALTRLAAAVGTSKGYMHDLCTKPERRPSPGMAKRIQDATGGKVSAMTLLGLEDAA